ncbi:hypothetical protein ILUMI_22664 [Ignelater luminosus]|uniref:Tectonic-1-3 N-terminal domain-containing protein n=1 Tax=Ignelater luminosus TaxID=2038154 RepID=A0A8K0CDD7_IGNLU|nr:hypothetical protein ILUMI_22664 [Ignelater luminosus]
MDKISSETTPSTSTTNKYNLTSTTIETTSPTFTTKSTDRTTCNTNDSSCRMVTKKPSTVTTPFTTIALKSSTTSPSTTTAPYFHTETFQDFNLDICTCDLQRRFCDINCCCDKDCSYENKKVFRSCKRELNFHRDTSFCQYMDYIYLNNTPYKWEVNQNGLFCIAKTNLPPQYTLQRKQPITSLDEAKQQKENKFSWPDTERQYDINFNSNQSFIYGTDIWMINNNSLELFRKLY